MKRSTVRSVVLAGVSLFALLRTAFGYIDPNTGGLIFQLLTVILASFTGIMLFFYRHIQMFMARVKRRLRGESQDVAESTSAAETTDNE